MMVVAEACVRGRKENESLRLTGAIAWKTVHVCSEGDSGNTTGGVQLQRVS